MSKVLALLLAVMMLVSMLAACGNNQTNETTGNILEIDLLADEVRSSFVDNAIDAVTYDGKIFALP